MPDFSTKDLKDKWGQRLLAGQMKFDYLNPQNAIIQKDIPNYSGYFNPGRARYLVDKTKTILPQDYSIPHRGEDVFCQEKDYIWERQKLATVKLRNYSWDILTNAFPIAEFHSLLLPTDHVLNQHLTKEYIEDSLELSKRYPEMTIATNSWGGSGASQNHFHSHIFFDPLPTTQIPLEPMFKLRGVEISQPKDHPIVCLVFSGGDKDSKLNVIQMYVDDLIKRQIPYNAVCKDGVFYLTPRSQDADTEGISRGVDSAFGKFPLVDRASFDSFDNDYAEDLLATIGYEYVTILGVIYGSPRAGRP